MRNLLKACLLFVWISSVAQIPAHTKAEAGLLAKARVFTPEQGTVRTMANGGESRSIVSAVLPTGESVAIHESTQVQGTKPNPPHSIEHSEFMLVREGTLAFEHDGVSEQAGPGSIIYVAYGTLHTVRNVGSTTAKYTVIAIGDYQK